MPVIQHARMNQNTSPRQIFIPFDEHSLDTLHAGDRLVAYRPGFVLLGQAVGPAIAQADTAGLIARAPGSGDRPVEPPAGLPHPR